MKLNPELQEFYSLNKLKIKSRLQDFKKISKDKCFYELIFCLCTPQSKAENALKVQNILENLDFKINEVNISEILRNPNNYIRFHNQKGRRILLAKENWIDYNKIIDSEFDNFTKRNLLAEKVLGFGLKEASHFLRNIGYENLAILDRHILKHLVDSSVINEIPKSLNKKNYLEIEEKFLEFGNIINIPIDELDLLFWSFQAGEIIK